MFKLKRLKIDRFRNVPPGTELVFNDGFNVLLGQNGSGKTTLLNLIAMVVRGDLSELKDEDYQLSWEMGDSEGKVKLTVALRYSTERMGLRNVESAQFSLPAQGGSEDWSYEVVLDVIGAHRRTRVTATPQGAFLEGGAASSRESIPVYPPGAEPSIQRCLLMMIALSPDRAMLIPLIPIGLIGQNGGRFDESLGAFSAFTALRDGRNERMRGGLRPCGVQVSRPRVPVDPLFRSFLSSHAISFIPTEIMDILDDASDALLEEPIIPHSKLPFLQRALELMRFPAADLRLTRLMKVGGMIFFADFTFRFTDVDGSQFSQDYLSYGQKRLLSFLYYVAANDHIVIADELVNGMHHEWIEACRDAIGERQAFLTSQNPLLLDYLPFTSAEEAQRTFILCASNLHEGRKQTRWYNMVPEDAASFYRAYEAGIQHVGDILRTKGLW